MISRAAMGAVMPAVGAQMRIKVKEAMTSLGIKVPTSKRHRHRAVGATKISRGRHPREMATRVGATKISRGRHPREMATRVGVTKISRGRHPREVVTVGALRRAQSKAGEKAQQTRVAKAQQRRVGRAVRIQDKAGGKATK